MTFAIDIQGRHISPNNSVYIIAEISANHNHSYDHAVELLHAVKETGADAVKIQTYTPDTITLNCNNEYFQIAGTMWEGRNLYDLYGEAYMPWEWQPKLQAIAAELGLDFFLTPFDASAVDFLEGMNVPAHKIASFEIVDIPLIEKVARTGKPLIISTGMASLGEIEEAVAAARNAGATDLALLKCTSAYPSLPEEMNLRTIPHLAQAFGLPVGLSDHTLGIAVPVAAVGVGACIIEKHITLSRSSPGPDNAFSLEPIEFKEMVDAVRIAEQSLGKVSYSVTEREAASRAFRRSLFVVQDVAEGDIFTEHNVRSIRPSYGLPPKDLPDVLGRRAARAVERGTPLEWNLVA